MVQDKYMDDCMVGRMGGWTKTGYLSRVREIFCNPLVLWTTITKNLVVRTPKVLVQKILLKIQRNTVNVTFDVTCQRNMSTFIVFLI